jgi:hypothetical protein
MMSYMYNHILNSHYSHANPWVGELANLPLYHGSDSCVTFTRAGAERGDSSLPLSRPLLSTIIGISDKQESEMLCGTMMWLSSRTPSSPHPLNEAI